MLRSLKKWLVGWIHGGPHFIVGEPSRPYLLRWYVLPRNPVFNVYVHKFMRDDDDRALHDHPWPSVSLCVWGSYLEQIETGSDIRLARGIGSIVFRRSTHAHRVELIGGRPAWTLFVTGPRLREWGFHCPRGWVHWKEFVSPASTGEIGKGCGES